MGQWVLVLYWMIWMARTMQRQNKGFKGLCFFPKTHHSSFCDIIDHIILPIMVWEDGIVRPEYCMQTLIAGPNASRWTWEATQWRLLEVLESELYPACFQSHILYNHRAQRGWSVFLGDYCSKFRGRASGKADSWIGLTGWETIFVYVYIYICIYN